MTNYKIATIAGDGIGPEITDATIKVLKAAVGESMLDFQMFNGGSNHYLKTGEVLPDDTYQGCRSADAILHGAAGLPGVVYPDGTEVGNDLHLRLRFKLDLYANVRPVKLLPGVLSPLRAFDGGGIDYVIIRENTEGLYASRGAGVVLRDEFASDSLVITRKGTERVAKFAFELAKKRNGAPRDGKSRVTVCDKANILRSYAFFRKVCDDVHSGYRDVEIDYAYADAITVHMVKKPDFYDVIVAENMFGDIISDLGAATVGGMGISPSGEIGDTYALFQGAHGSAPDIAGQNIASPVATVLSAVMMLRWLGDKKGDHRLMESADRIESAVGRVLAAGQTVPTDLGGTAKCTEMADAICRALA
ncbi:isocitrate/isopropylmalate dehydrogenase family protein [Ochrobactrum sp. EDr1-4]|uniref:isocitrate/isopropylmalate dehydrogenase family protein n=1 Tax=Ochrobactrum sp. EDr1-4 TaxID=3368622 RepID=UPI003B9EB31E